MEPYRGRGGSAEGSREVGGQESLQPVHAAVPALLPMRPERPTHTLQQIQGFFGVQPLLALLGVAHGLPELALCGGARPVS